MMRHIRPFELFTKLRGDRRVRYHIPEVAGVESLTVFALDTLVLIAAARAVKASRILEIGTAMGYNALHLALNLDASIVTVDIEDCPKPAWGQYPESAKIQSLVRDSATLEPSPYDMVFVDGEPTYEGFKRDTQLAFACSPTLVAWHDYGNPATPKRTEFFHELAEEKELIHIQDSWVVLWFENSAVLK
jgi:hypothetical protein